MYADWKSQVAYSSPNWNGFNFTVGVTQAFNTIEALETATSASITSATSVGRGGSQPAFEAKAAYAWTGDFAGKVWTSFISQKMDELQDTAGNSLGSDRANAWDLGATVTVAGFGLTGYYGQGDGTGTTVQFRDGYDETGKSRDSDDWYVQATYTIPGPGTKLGVSYGESTLDGNSTDNFDEYQNSMWTVGAYHPITKHLNLVAEYSVAQSELDVGAANLDGKSKTISLGAILFF
jgi:hypothetical protein